MKTLHLTDAEARELRETLRAHIATCEQMLAKSETHFVRQTERSLAIARRVLVKLQRKEQLKLVEV